MAKFEQAPQLASPNKAPIVNWMASYIFTSYYFSQGDPSLQNRFDAYMVDNFTDKVVQSYEHQKAIVTKAATMIGGFILGDTKKHIPFDSDKSEIFSEAGSRLDHILSPSGSESADDDRTIDKLLKLMIMRDEEHLFRGGLRMKDKSHIRYGKSIVLAHLVDGKPARHEVFDFIFTNARQYLASSQDALTVMRLEALDTREAVLQDTLPRDLSVFCTVEPKIDVNA